jgi:MFS family permease
VYQHTRDELSLGFIGLAEAIPMLGVSLVGGYVADRVNRQRTVTVAAGGLALCIALLMLVVWRFEAVFAVAGLWPIYLLIAGTGLVRAFMAPSQSALNAQLVPQTQIMYAANWNGTVFNIANMGGPALGGIIYGFLGPMVALATLFIYAIIGMILFMQVTPQPVMPRPAGETMLQSMQEGLKYVFSRQMLVGALALDMFAVLFGGAVALLPVFAERLGAGPVGLGFLRAAPAVGAVLISFWIARFPPAKHAGLTH